MTFPDTCKIPADTGAIYNGRCRYQDESLYTSWSRPADQSVDGGGMVFFPVGPRHALTKWLQKGDQVVETNHQVGQVGGGYIGLNSGDYLALNSVATSFGDTILVNLAAGTSQRGKLGKVERVGGRVATHIEMQDAAMGSDLGTPEIEVVLSAGPGAVVIAFTETDGATSYQAKVDGVNEGDAVGPNDGAISLYSLSAGSHSFVVTASDGTNTSDSDAVTFEVV